jgi:hypothetical protein
MFLIPENGPQFGFCSVKINQAANVNNIIIPKFQRYPQLFHYIIIAHILSGF